MTTSNSTLELTSLDFADIKNELIAFLKSQSRFKDINYQGSNINVLLDVLAYNSFMNAYYLNMVASEMFLDSAQLRSSVVSHAKELNYTPRSFRSSKAVVDLAITVDPNITEYFIPRKTTFSTTVGGNTFTFSTAASYSAEPVEGQPGVYTVSDLEIYEGVYQTESYVVDTTIENQKFIISSQTVDTTSIAVRVVEDGGDVVLNYDVVSSLFGLKPLSQVCFLQATHNGRYELTFGDNAFVRKPKNNSVVVVEYRVCSGELPNGAEEFTLNSSLTGDPDVVVTLVEAAAGGAVAESIEEIKFNAPRYFQTQERAVTASDYTVLLKGQFPEIQAISAYGGEEAEPPQYGKVLISVDLEDANGVTDARKAQYKEWIKTRMPLSIDPIIIDPEFIYVTVETTVKYNLNVTELSARDIQSIVLNAITAYSSNNLDDFNKTLRFSRFIDAIDSADSSIISNDTTLRIYKNYQPTTGVPISFTINFFNNIAKVRSSRFIYRDTAAIITDDGKGTLIIINATGNNIISSIGSVNYTTGRLQIDNITIDTFFGSGLSFTAETSEKDIFGVKNNILTIRGVDVRISVQGERI